MSDLTIVTITYSFDAEVVAVIFNTYDEAIDFIKTDYEEEKRIDISENGYSIDEEVSYCDENMAVLRTDYNGEWGQTTWTIAREIDRRK